MVNTMELMGIVISLLAFAYAGWLYLWVKKQPQEKRDDRKDLQADPGRSESFLRQTVWTAVPLCGSSSFRYFCSAS